MKGGYDWVWPLAIKHNRWQQAVIVSISGVFVRKEGADQGSNDEMLWFSNTIGLISRCSKFFHKSGSFAVEEKTAHWHISNPTNSVCNNIPKDDYDYIKFDSPKNAVMLLETQSSAYDDNYIIGVLIDETKACRELLGC